MPQKESIELLRRVVWNSRLLNILLLKSTLPNFCRNRVKNIDSIFKIVFMVLGKGGRLLEQFLAKLKSHVECK